MADMAADDDDFSKPEMVSKIKFGYSDLTSGQVKAIEQTFRQRAWWNRLWIVQEAVLASSAVVMCGNFTLPWITSRLLVEAEMPSKDWDVKLSGGGTF